MLKSIFSPDNPVFRFFIKIGYCWWLNILWLATSLPVITIGASTTALIYSCSKLHSDDGYPTVNFFHSFKENFKQATVIWLIYLAAGALLAVSLIFWNRSGMPGGLVLQGLAWALTLFYAMSLSYVFAIQSKFVNPVSRTILYSFVLPLKNLKETALILISIGAVVYFNVTTVFAVNFWTLNLGIGLLTYLLTVFYINVFNRYIPKQEEPAPLSEEEAERAVDEAADNLKKMFEERAEAEAAADEGNNQA